MQQNANGSVGMGTEIEDQEDMRNRINVMQDLSVMNTDMDEDLQTIDKNESLLDREPFLSSTKQLTRDVPVFNR